MKNSSYLTSTFLTLVFSSGVWAANTPGTVIDDSLMTANVKTALAKDPATKARQINVETSRGTVQLNGFVDSAQARQEAERVARQVAGVSAVDNNLQISSGDRSTGNVVDDGVITTRVNAALISDARVKAYKINTKTNKGVVTLGGFVQTPEEQIAAESIVGKVPGVVSVVNGIRVAEK